MFQAPDHFQPVSLYLSEVLSDVGINQEIVQQRRRTVLLCETLNNQMKQMTDNSTTSRYYGSNAEGTTTLGLNSDMDELLCGNTVNVIQNWDEWQHGKKHLLTIQDETTSPGYCLLQLLQCEKPLPASASRMSDDMSELLTISGERVVVKNTIVNRFLGVADTINGPAASIVRAGFKDSDMVVALHCKSWPKEAHHWLIRQGIGVWPSNDLKRYSESTGFFVVPVSSKSGRNQGTEWRISTSAAERCLMFSLNMTQIRCYVLLKMIVKTFIDPQCSGVISSFICKTVLFHVILGTMSNFWRNSNLLACLLSCLTVLQKFVTRENCPHFMIPENNLLAGKISPSNKLRILEILQHFIESDGRQLLDISFDDIGTRLQVKMNGMNEAIQFYMSPAKINAKITKELLYDIASSLSTDYQRVRAGLQLSQNDIVLAKVSHAISKIRSCTDMASNSLDTSAAKLLLPLLFSSFGSVKASGEIYNTHSVSPGTLTWLSAGLNSDVASGRLKLASVFYCAGDMERAEVVLKNTKDKYDLNTVEPVCGCYDFKRSFKNRILNRLSNEQEKMIQEIKAFCVTFMRCETYCVLNELQYELFRSTKEDLLHRNKYGVYWMNMAVVDSLPFLYFLQYKTYNALKRGAEKQHALGNLVTTIDTEPNLGHRETALNLLGQCMEQEHRHNDALHCYMKSLTIRARNNVANIHICRLINAMVNKQFM